MIVRAIRSDRGADNRGSITVEATIALVTFLLAIMSVLSAISICRAQYRIGRALKDTALDISRYSYFYFVTGGYSSAHSIKQSMAELIVDRRALSNGDTGMESLAEFTQILFGEGKGGLEEGGRFSLLSDEDTASIIISLLSECTDELSSKIIAAPIAKSVFYTKLGLADAEIDRYLKTNGVINGWSGLDFGMSEMFSSKAPREISLCVSYSIRIPFLCGLSLPVNQRAVSGAWLGGDRTVADSSFYGYEGEYSEGSYSGSIWSMSAINRGLLFKEVFSRQYTDTDSVSGMRGVIGYEPSGNTYHNCVSINIFSESYNSNGFQVATSCEHTIRKLKVTINEVQNELADEEQATISYTVIIPEDADEAVGSEIEDYLIRRAFEFQKQNPSLSFTFRIVKAGGKAGS